MQIWLVLQELGLDNLGGIFVVTFAGVALASIACIVELLCVTYQDSAELGTTWWYEIRSGLNICWNIWFFLLPLSGHGQVLRSVVQLLVVRRGCPRSRSCGGGTFRLVLMRFFCVVFSRNLSIKVSEGGRGKALRPYPSPNHPLNMMLQDLVWRGIFGWLERRGDVDVSNQTKLVPPSLSRMVEFQQMSTHLSFLELKVETLISKRIFMNKKYKFHYCVNRKEKNISSQK